MQCYLHKAGQMYETLHIDLHTDFLLKSPYESPKNGKNTYTIPMLFPSVQVDITKHFVLCTYCMSHFITQPYHDNHQSF